MMLSDSKTEEDPNSKKWTKERIDRTLSSTFDEFFIEISLGSRFHPTEKHNREVHLQEHPFSKIYDLINSYHAFCKLCEQHFYSRSVADDINSFFQKHTNTSYHKQMRVIGLPPNDTPIFTWEEKFHSGRCNICDMPGLNSFILNTKFDPLQLVKLHFCVWDQESRKTNEKVLRKLTLLKKFCGLKIFREIYIKTINGRGVCLLCCLKLPWSGEKARCHLISDGHYQKFCELLKKYFDFSPKDVLNGFNLEMITRWLISHEPSVPDKFIDCHEWKICLHHSNSIENPYPEEKDNFSYSPNNVKNLLKTQVANFIPNEKYFLYNVAFYRMQMCSELRQVKGQDFDLQSFYTSKNQQKQLHIIENYQRLKLGPEEPCTPPSSDKLVKHTKQAPSQINCLKKLFMKKLKWVADTFVSASGGKIFCQVCDQYLPRAHKIIHLNSFSHKSEEKKWEQLKANFENTKFMEPFQETKNAFLVCLICGAVFDTNNFFSHLKGVTHMRKFEWYSNLKSSIPISSALVIRADLSCYCTICNSVLSQKVHLLSLKTALKNVKLHWPCPALKKKADLTNESIVITEGNKELIKENESALGNMSITNSTSREASEESEMKSRNMSASKNVTDFKKVERTLEKTVENIVTIFEKKIMNNAFDKSAYLISRLDNFILIATKEKIKQPTVHRETSCEYALKCSCTTRSSSEDERKRDISEKCKNELITQKAEIIKKQKEGKSTDKEEKKSDLSNKIVAIEEERQTSINQDLVHLLREPQKLINSMLSFNVQAVMASESPMERKREEIVCNTIISAVLEYFPQSRCYPFGSRLSGLMLNNSDLDVFFDCGGMYEGFKNTTPSSERKLVNKVAGLLRKRQEITEIIVVDKARVPIISFLHKPTLMRCDLSFKNGLSIQNTLLIKFMLSLDWRVRPLILFLKHWAKLNGLHGPPYFSSYALAMLVIYYLEQLERPVLPTIESLQNNYVGRRTTIGGWDCSINVNTKCIPKSENKDSLPQLLMGLFGFYGSFDYSANIISPLTGKPLPRELFSHSGFAKLPMCYKRHILNIPVPIENLVNSSILICVMDPFDLSHILTKSFTSRGLRMFIGFCQASEMHLEKGLSVSDLKR